MTPFGKYIQAKREEAGLSRTPVAEQLGVSSVYLRDVELGLRSPLKPERWGGLVAAIPGLSLEDLEFYAGLSRPIRIDVSHMREDHQRFLATLVQRLRNKTLKPKTIKALLAVLEE